jgi:acetyl-CoA synthetase
MFRAYLGEPERYARCFVGALYLSGDRARRDGEGRYWFVSRCDEVIKSAGHLIGAFEVESALLEHPAIAEAAVIGKPTPTIGEMVKAFVTLRSGHHADETTRRSVTAFARKRLGPVLAPREIDFVASLPKTRSGKIMRRLLLARELGMPEGDISSLATSEGGDDSA